MICLNIINYNEEESGIGGLTAAIYAAKAGFTPTPILTVLTTSSSQGSGSTLPAGFPALLSRENLPLSAF